MEIPIIVDEPTGAPRAEDLVLGGVPVPSGELECGGWFALRGEDGKQFLVEGAPSAFWPDGSVKWLHLCGTVDLAGGKRNRFALLPGQSAPEGKLSVQSQSGCVSVRGGVLDVDVRADAADLLSVRRAGTGEALLEAPGVSAALAFVGPQGEDRREWGLSVDEDAATDTLIFGFDGDPSVRPLHRLAERKHDPVEVVVRTANRVVVRVAGAFVGEKGRIVSELILFVEVYREVPEVRLQPVFIYLGTPDEDLVESLALTVHSTIRGDGCRYGFANEQGRGYWDVVLPDPLKPPFEGGPRWPTARQVQLGSSFYRTEKRTFPVSSWVKAVEGRRSQGWAHLAGEQGGITAATRYFWQEYPRSTTIDADAGTITFGLVPAEARPLDLRRYSPIVYGDVSYEAGGPGPFPDRTHGARGIAKAHELMLRFHAPGEDDAPQRGLFFAHPCRMLTEGGHFARAEVIGRVAPLDPHRHRRVEAHVARIMDFIVRERDVRGWYGLADFGDVQMSFSGKRDVWAFDGGGYAWLNTEAIPDYGLWINALRACRSDWLEASIEMSRHNRDVDCYHRGMFMGWGSRHNVNHWGCADKEWRVSMPLVRRLHYYLTADPWTRETILNTVTVYQSYERTALTAPSITSALAGVLTKWEMTGDPADGEVVRNLADLFARAVRDDGQFTAELHVDLATGVGEPVGDRTLTEKAMFMDVFGGQHVLIEVAELLDHGGLSDALVAHARYRAGKSSTPNDYGKVLVFLAHAYRRTGDPQMERAIRLALSQEAVRFEEVGSEAMLDEPRHTVIAGQKGINKVISMLGRFLHKVPYGLAVLEEDALEA